MSRSGGRSAAEKPDFVVTVGDTIEGLVDAKAAGEWAGVRGHRSAVRAIPLYLTPGNHDIWSAALRAALPEEQRAARRTTASTAAAAHFTVLDNSRTEQLADEEIAFLEADLKAQRAAPVKFVVSHRPSWILNVALRNPDFPLHELAKQYGVNYVIAGHIHQMLRFELDGVEYISMPSAGGHLRASGEYRDGWFFGYTVVDRRQRRSRFTS